MMVNLQPLLALAGTVQIPKTGQTTSFATGDDGAIQAGVTWPSPRFVDNANGTVTDNLTGLIWLKNGNCTATVGGINKSSGWLVWADALTWSNALANGACGLSDGSTAGQWRLPNIKELKSVFNRQTNSKTWLNTVGFYNIQNDYWSSTTVVNNTGFAFTGGMQVGTVNSVNKTYDVTVWPVRGGQ
jgi:hypothetical protein